MTLLSAESLAVRAADGTDLLSDVSLSVEPGETLLLAGPPGSGKTLLAKALKGLLANREDLDIEGTVTASDAVGFVFQSPGTQLVRRVVERDVAFGLENRGVAVEEIEARITEHAAALDAESLLERPVRELSGGETALVAILGVLVTEPDVVILDEPLAPLDQPNTELVLSAIDRLRRSGTAVVIAEHDLRDLLCRTDRVLLLADGRVAARGPPREVVADLAAAGIKLPFDTEVAVTLVADGADVSVPLSAAEAEVELP